ncbi:MAG: DDE-type integrase/transposase/recombinase [Gammaproteobacteria bacterium]|nr:DDE-type integrase/transposase/recombinase [Gammaproteobacteria bacterium]
MTEPLGVENIPVPDGGPDEEVELMSILDEVNPMDPAPEVVSSLGMAISSIPSERLEDFQGMPSSQVLEGPPLPQRSRRPTHLYGFDIEPDQYEALYSPEVPTIGSEPPVADASAQVELEVYQPVRPGSFEVLYEPGEWTHMVRAGKCRFDYDRGVYILDDYDLVAVPRVIAEEVVRKAHYYGHGGIAATMDLIRSAGLYVANAREIARQVCADCWGCAQGKLNNNVPRLGKLPKPQIPFEGICIDFVGEKTLKRQDGVKFLLLVFVDLCSGHTWAYELKAADGKAVLRCFQSYTTCFGTPKFVLSDQDSAYSSDDFKWWLESRGIEYRHSPAYHPQSNGKVERAIYTISDSVRATLLQRPSHRVATELYEAIHKALYRINNTTHAGNPLTPNQQIFIHGIKRAPFVKWDQPQRDDVEDPEGLRFQGKFKTGDKVILKDHLPLARLAPRFSAPGVVLKKVGNYRYLVRIDDGGPDRHYAEGHI